MWDERNWERGIGEERGNLITSDTPVRIGTLIVGPTSRAFASVSI
jgi:hypothetical protein